MSATSLKSYSPVPKNILLPIGTVLYDGRACAHYEGTVIEHNPSGHPTAVRVAWLKWPWASTPAERTMIEWEFDLAHNDHTFIVT